MNMLIEAYVTYFSHADKITYLDLDIIMYCYDTALSAQLLTILLPIFFSSSSFSILRSQQPCGMTLRTSCDLAVS